MHAEQPHSAVTEASAGCNSDGDLHEGCESTGGCERACAPHHFYTLAEGAKEQQKSARGTVGLAIGGFPSRARHGEKVGAVTTCTRVRTHAKKVSERARPESLRDLRVAQTLAEVLEAAGMGRRAARTENAVRSRGWRKESATRALREQRTGDASRTTAARGGRRTRSGGSRSGVCLLPRRLFTATVICVLMEIRAARPPVPCREVEERPIGRTLGGTIS